MEIFLDHWVVGSDTKVPTIFGEKRYINFDNAASTPPFKNVLQSLINDLDWYSSVHRGAGYKSKYTTEKYELARTVVSQFLKADLNDDVVIFTKNTTDSINKMSHYLSYLPGEIIIYTTMEHHSNELPWQSYPHHCIGLKNDSVDLDELEMFLNKNKGKVKLVAVTGASNVTGLIPPIYTIAEMAHRYGAKIMVDGAQLIAHRPIEIRPHSDPRHLDFLAFSGHKMYAPFGSGVLIGPKKLFSQGIPSQVGGGTLKALSMDGVIWAPPPENEEAGSPNVLGALAIAEAIKTFQKMGWEKLIFHEQQLINHALAKMKKIDGITIFNDNPFNRVGVISFNINGLSHQKTADLLANYYGIGVRNGCFCARRYVLELLNQKLSEVDKYREYHSGYLPGLVRLSFGCYNRLAEIDIFCEAIKEIIKRKNVA